MDSTKQNKTGILVRSVGLQGLSCVVLQGFYDYFFSISRKLSIVICPILTKTIYQLGRCSFNVIFVFNFRVKKVIASEHAVLSLEVPLQV